MIQDSVVGPVKLPIVVAFLSGICVTLVVLSLLKFPIWKRNNDQSSFGASSDSALLELGREANSSIDAPKNPPPEAETIVWPASPKDAVADAVSNLSGQALESKLFEAGDYYIPLGIEEAKEFCLALPPGDIGRRTLRWVIRYAEGYEPEMMDFLKEEEEHFSPGWVRSSTWSLVNSWKDSNTTEALDYLTNAELFNEEEKRLLINSILHRPPNDLGDL